MEKTICEIIEKDGVLRLNMDTDINTALNALILFTKTFYNSAIKDSWISEEETEYIIKKAFEMAIKEAKED